LEGHPPFLREKEGGIESKRVDGFFGGWRTREKKRPGGKTERTPMEG
jgi:hypothetical protein